MGSFSLSRPADERRAGAFDQLRGQERRTQGDTAIGEAASQQTAGPLQPPLDLVDGPAQLRGRLVARLALQATQQEQRQHQEGGLAGVLGVLLVVQHPPARSQDGGAVAPHQGRERCLVPLAHEGVQQRAVRDRGWRLLVRHFAEVPERSHSAASPIPSTLLCSAEARWHGRGEA
jgi:hypothetical protein